VTDLLLEQVVMDLAYTHCCFISAFSVICITTALNGVTDNVYVAHTLFKFYNCDKISTDKVLQEVPYIDYSHYFLKNLL